MTTEAPSINIRDLSKYPRPVAKIIAEAVNKHGVDYRDQDGSHLRLYCGDRKVIPIKIAASRDAEHTLRYLIPWLEQHVESWLQADVTTEAIETLAEAVNTTPKPVRAKPVTEADEPKFKCDWKGCSFVAKNAAGLRMHIAGHTGEKKKHAAKSAETARLRREQEKIVAEQALAALAELHGLKVSDSDSLALKAQVMRLEAQVKTLTKERDDAQARVELLNEAFRGLA